MESETMHQWTDPIQLSMVKKTQVHKGTGNRDISDFMISHSDWINVGLSAFKGVSFFVHIQFNAMI